MSLKRCQSPSFFPLASALALVAATTVAAAEEKKSDPGSCTCPTEQHRSAPRKYAGLTPDLDESDEIAALENVQLALSELGDGATYVWHRRQGRLSGFVQPTASFKDAAGNVCRHVVLVLTTEALTKKAEGIACRLPNGRWQLEG